MAQNTNAHDELLDRTLREELSDERSMMAESLGVFTGKRRFWNMYAAAVTFATFAAAIFAVVRFFGATGTDAKLLWATVFLAALIFTLALKVYFWMQMVRNEVLREVKRLEVRVASGG